jgi:hypothetical protein
MGNGFIFRIIDKKLKRKKILGGPFRIYQLISTANPAQFEWNWA